VAPGLRAIFVGINPGMASARTGHHFANPRNDFWRLLHDAQLTPRVLAPAEQWRLLEYGLGVTNAASRATPGSGDLRVSDFAGAGERLATFARQLRPGYLAFVGKEAYRGAFGRRAALGRLAERLGDSELFILPSTSPANAAVSYDERLRWFQELAGRLTRRPLRPGVRALVVDPADRILLVRFAFGERTWWAPPGGGLEPGESELDALERELLEEVGLKHAVIGPCVWTREHWFAEMPKWAGQRERIFLVRTPEFEPAGTLGSDALREEGVAEIRWWTPAELASSGEIFAPRRLQSLLPELLRGPLPDEPIDVGV
jgi:TDG/mug DNA glycosylase family protein